MPWDRLVLTLDVDWAPDFIIDWVAERLVERRIPCTWFVTHASPGVDRLRRHPDLFELGIHPNFLAGSTHGTTVEEVVAHCMAVVPEATLMRTHCLWQSNHLFNYVLRNTAIVGDSSLFLAKSPGLSPAVFRDLGHELVRFPIFWEDDMETEARHPTWSVGPYLRTPGMRIFNVHPVHVYLNSSTMDPYRRLAACAYPLHEVTPAQAEPLIADGPGARTFFESLVEVLGDEPGPRLGDLVPAALAGAG